MAPIDTSAAAEADEEDDDALEGTSPMSLAAGADFADMVRPSAVPSNYLD